VSSLICTLLTLYVIALFVRIVLSWFPMTPGGPGAGIYSFLFQITEPVLGPVRQVMPRFGMFDFSPIVVILGVRVLQAFVC
jgi:YggT family protein